jgi:hypothetical protein
MECYYHREVSAVGICKSCHKGVCEQCAVDVGSGLACRGECEHVVSSLNEYIKRNIDMMTNVRNLQGYYARVYRIFGFVLGVLGVMAIALGMAAPRGNPFLLILGFLPLILGIGLFALGTKVKTAFRQGK